MSILVLGASFRSAPLSLLERLALDADGVDKLLAGAIDSEHVTEAVVVATCNRVEVYAEVDRFHGGVDDISTLLEQRAGWERRELAPHLYVRHDDAAVAHAFAVAAGLDSMVVGESQILGQVRDALSRAQEAGAAGASLNSLFQQALRVGKRAHAETGIDHAGRSLVSVALDRVAPAGLAGRRALVVGAGSMAALAATTLRRRGVAQLVVAGRDLRSAQRLAEAVDGSAAPLTALTDAIADADVVVSCTGAAAVLISAEQVAPALGDRRGEPLAIVDLALPHDVAPEVAALPNVWLVGLADLADTETAQVDADDVAVVRRIVAEEVATFTAARRAARVTPTVVALRTMATGVVEAELARLDARLPGLDPLVRADVEQAVRRVAHKLLHAPTVRVKQLAGKTADSSYADALAELFALESATVQAVSDAEAVEAATDVRDGRA